MKANLLWIKKLLQVSFVPAEIRPGKSRPEIYIYIYMVPPQKKPTSLHVFLVFAPMSWKKIKNLRKQKNNIPGLLQKQKSKKPRENQKKKQYSRTLAKVKMQKSIKPREIQNCFFCFFWFSRGFLDFCIFTFARVLEYFFFLFFCFFWFSRGFLDFCFCKSPGIFFFVFCCFLKVFLVFICFFLNFLC